MQRACDLAEVLRWAAEAEAAYDDFALSLGQCLERRTELRDFVVSPGIPRRIGCRAVGEHLVERRLERGPRVRCRAGLDDDVDRQPELGRDLECGRDVAARGGELGFRTVDRTPSLDDALRQSEEP